MSNSKVMLPGKIQWWGGSSIKQNFSLPPSIMYYLAKNPSNSKVYSKLIKTCKFFFEKLPILVVADMYRDMFGDVRICNDKECSGHQKCCLKFNTEKNVAQIWLTNLLYLPENVMTNYTSLLCPKIYQSEVIKLVLCNQTLSYEEFKLLVPYVREVGLDDVEMRYFDGRCVMLEEIIKAMHNVKEFSYKFKPGHSVVDATTIKKIAGLENLGSLLSFRLCNIPGSFKVQDLSDFIMSRNDIKFWLSFDDSLSDGYRAELDALIDTVIESQITGCLVKHDDLDEDKWIHMLDLY